MERFHFQQPRAERRGERSKPRNLQRQRRPRPVAALQALWQFCSVSVDHALDVFDPTDSHPLPNAMSGMRSPSPYSVHLSQPWCAPLALDSRLSQTRSLTVGPALEINSLGVASAPWHPQMGSTGATTPLPTRCTRLPTPPTTCCTTPRSGSTLPLAGTTAARRVATNRNGATAAKPGAQRRTYRQGIGLPPWR